MLSAGGFRIVAQNAGGLARSITPTTAINTITVTRNGTPTSALMPYNGVLSRRPQQLKRTPTFRGRLENCVICEVDMTKDELIVKQKLEIEELKQGIYDYKMACSEARMHLYRPEQWSMKCPDFPKVAMAGIVNARQAIDSI